MGGFKDFKQNRTLLIRSSYRPPYFYINRGPYEPLYESFHAGFEEIEDIINLMELINSN